MGNSKHYRWQTRWTISAGRATHESGVIVDLQSGRIVSGAEVLEALRAKHGHNLPAVLDRMQREAAALAAVDDPRKARL
jgi:hypothetical protein